MSHAVTYLDRRPPIFAPAPKSVECWLRGVGEIGTLHTGRYSNPGPDSRVLAGIAQSVMPTSRRQARVDRPTRPRSIPAKACAGTSRSSEPWEGLQ